jgi:rhomboid protease GluP
MSKPTVKSKGMFSNPQTISLVMLMIFMFFIQITVIRVTGQDRLQNTYAKWNEAIARGEWWRLVTYGLVHGTVIHFLGNLVGLFSLGTWMGHRLPGKTILAIFLAGILGGGIASYLFTPERMIGNSPGFYALCAAWLVFLVRYGGKGEKIFWVLVIIVGVWISLLPGSDRNAHFGGLAVGLVAGLLVIKPSIGSPSIQTNKEE